MGKTKLAGLKQKINNCKARLYTCISLSEKAPTKAGRTISRETMFREKELLQKLQTQLKEYDLSLSTRQVNK